jgi:transmembrane sensor
MTGHKPLAGDSAAPSIKAEAAAWLARLHGPARTSEVEAGLRRWLRADPEHRRAFEALTEVWEQLATPLTAPLPRVAHHYSAPRLGLPSLWAIATITVLVSATVLFHLFKTPSYVTGTGEQRQLTLTDGSRVWLDGQTRIDVDYRSTTREIRLRRGEAYFEVSHNPKRPFIVHAGTHSVTALGTVFDVRYVSGKTAVTLLEGRVQVDAAPSGRRGADDETARVLSPGDRLKIEPNSPAALDRPALSTVTAWRFGEVMFDNTLLSAAIEELNRDNPTKMILDNPAIGALRVSGVYHTGDNAEFARSVAALYRLSVAEQDGQLHLRGEPAE